LKAGPGSVKNIYKKISTWAGIKTLRLVIGYEINQKSKAKQAEAWYLVPRMEPLPRLDKSPALP
jgi:hypothetical protein